MAVSTSQLLLLPSPQISASNSDTCLILAAKDSSCPWSVFPQIYSSLFLCPGSRVRWLQTGFSHLEILAGDWRGEEEKPKYFSFSLFALGGFSGALAPTGQTHHVSTLSSGDSRPSALVTPTPSFVSLA